MEWSSKGSVLPPASLQLLVPPVRIMSAFVWQVVQQHNVKQYDKLLDFISLVTEMVPELLSPSQKAQLVLGLRARLVLELCRSDGFANLKAIQSHLDKIHTCSAELSISDQMESTDILKTSYSNFASLVQNILSVPFEKEFFFQEVFPEKYGSAYNERIQQLVSLFLSRLEQLLPIPDLQQTTAWLTETFASEEFGVYLSRPETLKTLLLHHRELKTLSSAPSGNEEDVILSTLALPAHTGGERFCESYSDGDEDEDEYDSNEGTLALENLEEDSSQSLDEASADWVPKKKTGLLSYLLICPLCSFTHRLKRKVQEHMQSEHHMSAPIRKKKSSTNVTKKTQQKRQNLKVEKKKQEGVSVKLGRCKQKDGKNLKHKQKDNVENRKRRRPKQSAGEDKRFLSTRPANKNFPNEETRCPTCEKVFEHPNQLKTHMKIHSFRYRCGQCDKGFTSQSGYYQHQRLHKRGRRFICKQCNKGFLCRYSLKQHERLHNGPTNLCNICGKNFSKNGFIRHMQMHRGERNYLCTTCGKSFLSSGELLLHTRSHTGELPYTCKQCGKGFSCKSHLNVHMRSHTGERPYLCSECPKRFLTLNCLKRHTLSHNGVKPFKCPNCGREFSQQGNLKRHMTTHKTDT